MSLAFVKKAVDTAARWFIDPWAKPLNTWIEDNPEKALFGTILVAAVIYIVVFCYIHTHPAR